MAQLHPSFVDGGQLSSQGFRPTPKYAGRLSTARASAVSAADHFTEYTVDLSLAYDGVWAVSVGEVVGLGLSAWSDAESDQAPTRARRGIRRLTSRTLTEAGCARSEAGCATTPWNATGSTLEEIRWSRPLLG